MFGTNVYLNDRWYYSLYTYKAFSGVLMDNKHTVVQRPLNLDILADDLTSKALTFLDSAASSSSPFLLFYSFPQPHSPFVKRGWSSHGGYGDSVMEMDMAIGKVLDQLDELNITNDTLVYFASDHGPDLGDPDSAGGSSGPFRGGKSVSGLEGATRVPGVFRWPGVIEPGSISDVLTSQMDFFPTILSIVENDLDLEQDGINILPLLKGQQIKKDRFIVEFCSNLIFSITFHSNGDTFPGVFKVKQCNKAV